MKLRRLKGQSSRAAAGGSVMLMDAAISSENLPPACVSLMAPSQGKRARLHYLSPVSQFLYLPPSIPPSSAQTRLSISMTLLCF